MPEADKRCYNLSVSYNIKLTSQTTRCFSQQNGSRLVQTKRVLHDLTSQLGHRSQYKISYLLSSFCTVTMLYVITQLLLLPGLEKVTKFMNIFLKPTLMRRLKFHLFGKRYQKEV